MTTRTQCQYSQKLLGHGVSVVNDYADMIEYPLENEQFFESVFACSNLLIKKGRKSRDPLTYVKIQLYPIFMRN